MKKALLWIAEKRILDGYVGVCGMVLFYKIFAKYFSGITVFELSMKAWKWMIFHVSIQYNISNKTNSAWNPSLPFDLKLIVLRFRLIDLGKESRKVIHERAEKLTTEYKVQQAEEKRLIQAAKDAGL